MNINKDDLIKLIDDGLTRKQISVILKVSLSTIKRICKKNNLESKYRHKKCEIICKKCSKKFYDIESENRIFCSISCSNSFHKKKNIKKCENCNTEIKGARHYSRFCCRRCYIEYNKKEREKLIIKGNVKDYSSSKKYLIEVKGEKCEICGWDQKNKVTGKVPIQIDHINGLSEDNRIENLRLLCPNCHSLTETFGSLNKGNGRKHRYKKKISPGVGIRETSSS